MHVRVQKYGGTSLGDSTQVGRVADRIVAAHRSGGPLVVVVSAMGGTTDDLLRLARSVGSPPEGRELDRLLSTGECASAALMTLALQHRDTPACSLTGAEAGIVTDGQPGRARIVDVEPGRIRAELAEGRVVVVAGFQGRAREGGYLTTLGRGGSDATATALAAALRAEVCEVGTDVDGVYTADPRWVPEARLLRHLSYPHMLELARGGAKVLMTRCVEFGMVHQVPLWVRAATGDSPGTWIGRRPPRHAPEFSEHSAVVGLAHLAGQTCYTVAGLADEPEAFANAFAAIVEAGVVPDLTARTASATRSGGVDLSFVVSEEDVPRADAALADVHRSCDFDQVHRSEKVGKLSVVGTRLRSDPEISATLLRALSAADVAVRRTEIGDGRIVVLCPEEQLVPALAAAHDAFVLSGHLAGARAEEAGGQVPITSPDSTH
ncbi:aspartate kinase [Amycolatopsis sp. NPDC059021]|uniref:aspartate kinase n=1 Tax=Amycolatopsis sp. NPDC059021 TaxID=3346704 RepID=UPI0036712107